ncbi:FAD-dependent oxidoreductase [Dehalococcoides sp. THU3]|uniref:FAD-dependent oxidoreductase n=1 Tax=Dehalococcoides TaxID=61434 RepID=UPI0005B57219|nr:MULTISPECIES: FAD-dependent oxidoreductase [Dehalococcoides]QYY58554.1 4Fe-4S binding protein [Dehalococcoides mccartyi]BAQ34066.1 putative oxidoreductase [Dehalococcoides sp. UCH007]
MAKTKAPVEKLESAEEIQKDGKVVSTKRTKGSEFFWTQSRCTGCNRCASVCPVDAIKLDRDKTPTKRVGTSPCTRACPAGLDIPRYVRFVADGNASAATAVMREKIPFPSVCGYVCFHPCELECQRQKFDEPIAIRALKRYAAENDDGSWKNNLKIAPPTGKKVAIIGSGPAGLTSAYFLTLLGHEATIFESMEYAGGKMFYSIPEHQLPKDILNKEIKAITDLGVTIHTSCQVQSVQTLFKQGYDSVLLSTGVLGLDEGLLLPCDETVESDLMQGSDFLKNIKSSTKESLGDKVVVIGGGSEAYNSAFAAKSLGVSEVHLVCSRHTGSKEASPEEVDRAIDAGVTVHPSLDFVKLVKSNDKIEGVELFRIRSYGYDKDNRLHYEIINDTRCLILADTVITTVTPDEKPGADYLTVVQPGVFAAGDGISGARSVIEAMAAGRSVAGLIDKYLGGEGNLDETLAPPEKDIKPLSEPKGQNRSQIELNLVKQAGGDKVEIEKTLSPVAAKKEARRCLRCDIVHQVHDYSLDTSSCTYCGRCVNACYWDAITSGYGYEAAAKKRQAEIAALEEKHSVYNYAIRILPIAIGLMILAAAVAKLFK